MHEETLQGEPDDFQIDPKYCGSGSLNSLDDMQRDAVAFDEFPIVFDT